MIWELLLWLALWLARHALQHPGDVLIASLAFAVVHATVNRDVLRPRFLVRRAVWQTLRVTRAIYSLVVATACVIVAAACSLVTGQWQQLMIAAVVTFMAAARYKLLSVRPQPASRGY